MAECGVPSCDRDAITKLCRAHQRQWDRHGQLWTLGTGRVINGQPYRPVQELLEDLPVLIARGATVDGAACHFHYQNRHSLYRQLHRAHRDDLWAQLRANEN